VRNTLSDVLHLRRADLGITATSALRCIAAEERGVMVVLAGDDDAGAQMARLRTIDGAEPAEDPTHWRRLGLGAQILADLGVRRLRVVGPPRKLVGLAGFGLEVVGHEEPVDAAG